MGIRTAMGRFAESWEKTLTADTAYTNEVVHAAIGAGYSLYITDIEYSMGATSRAITLLNGSGGTTRWQRTPAINGTDHVTFKTPLKVTSNTALCLTTAGASVGFSITVCGFFAAD
jgi:hypothetical protein